MKSIFSPAFGVASRVTESSHEYLGLLGAKEKVVPVGARKYAGVLLARRGSSNVDVVPVEAMLLEMVDIADEA